MKIWIKVLLGALIGGLLGAYLPEGSAAFFSVSADLVINIGYYVLFPLVFFSLAVGVFELRKEGMTLRVIGRALAYLLISTLLLVVIGIASVVLLAPDRIPIIIEQDSPFSVPTVTEVLFSLFPRNIFSVFAGSGLFLLPLYVLAFFLGLNFTFDRSVTKPVAQFFDSLSRVLYHANRFLVEILGLGMVALTANMVFTIKGIPEFELFGQLLLLLSINTVLILFGVFPLILYFLTGKENPYKWLYGIISPLLAAAVSGDINFTLSSLIHHSRENLGISRRVGSAVLPLYALFGKAGTAMVTSVAFIVILKSYSSLGVSIPAVLWVLVFSFLVSFITGPFPGSAAFIGLAVLCSWYGKGIEEGFLILRPVMPLLISFGVFLDTATAAFAGLLVARHEEQQHEIYVKDFA
jgi:Na+/H+-dicarboxylate symporter